MALLSRLTLLQRFTLVSAVIAVGLAIVLSAVTVRVITAISVQDEAQVAAEAAGRSCRGPLGHLPCPGRRDRCQGLLHGRSLGMRRSSCSSAAPLAWEVSRLAEALGRMMGLPGGDLDDLQMAARLHDLGKIAVPDAILMKTGPLTPKEWEIMRRHAEAGYEILKDAPLSKKVKLAVRHNHERWDGTGYPDGLAGNDIPLFSRVLAVVDAYEAMTSERPYRRALAPSEAQMRLRAGAGTQFDPALVDVFLRHVLTPSKSRSYNEPLVSVAVSGSTR